MGRAVLGALPLCRVASAKPHHEDHGFPKPKVCCAHHDLRQYHLIEKLFLVCLPWTFASGHLLGSVWGGGQSQSSARCPAVPALRCH